VHRGGSILLAAFVGIEITGAGVHGSVQRRLAWSRPLGNASW
jgi:hypothetical protein